MKLLNVYVPPLRPYQSFKYDTIAKMAEKNDTYWEEMEKLWLKGETFLNLEHDIECNDQILKELAGCTYPNCTFAYKIKVQPNINFSDSTVKQEPLPNAMWCQRNSTPRDGGWYLDEIKKDDEWATHSGIGICKITPTHHTSLPLVHWTGMEWAVNNSLISGNHGKWHVHWPEVKHWHK